MKLTQQEIELRMYSQGIDRCRARINRAEEAGEAARNPYAATILRDFVMPLARILHTDVMECQPGMRAAHAQLLRPLDLEAVALLTVRTVLSALLSNTGDNKLRPTAYNVGRTIHCELVLAQIEHLSPDLYHTLANDFNRRRSKNLRHRMTVFRMQAEKNGIELDMWDTGSRDQVGMYLLERLQTLGMIFIQPPAMRNGKKIAGRMADRDVHLTVEVSETINKIKGITEIMSPLFGPCVEPPRDWTAFDNGGFHTRDMIRTHPYMVKAHSSARQLLRDANMPKVLKGLNQLQRTAWRVNTRILDVILQVAEHSNVGEIVSMRETGKPVHPEWLNEVQDTSTLDDARMDEFIAWKRSMSKWYTDRKLLGTKYARFYSATRAATTFKEYDDLYFVYFADSRGRFYPLTYGINPQGSDLQKSLLHFSKGKPLHTEHARRWFLIHGANKWGFDKATLQERVDWHKDKDQMLMAIASDPVNRTEWQDADSPLQFLAWCFEYAEWQIDPEGFESRIAVSMDGSCNGLQNFSAMLRDEVGGKATNLTNNVAMEDIYRRVAEAATKRMQASTDPDDAVLRSKWLTHGIDRSVVKRSVMTTPYGVTKRSAIRYVIDDYLKFGKAPCFTEQEHYAAANVLMTYAWPAIGDVVVKSREAMDWLSACAKLIVDKYGDDNDGVISWVTPSGFVSTQAYYQVNEHRITTRINGITRLKVLSEKDEAHSRKHANGLAPNFVHSMDAAHLHLVSAACADKGFDLAMIHDDYGTHAADSEEMYHIIREVFVKMYEQNDPIEEFARAYPVCPVPPKKGTLNLREVLDSHYFFS
jgi:DNA-directed RNA polymerase